ncbi:unnamed protein product [Psylliodes chrysocephalus]|uniref:Methyltransferase domain-containing protein n=1 Tax=Psylliodes chrysocephalus TaxID=3402493 RepID=A0A9P0CSZ4_9CUCU|nr:unnamed protein product [Psylliodes chrysocephala]
MSLPLSYSNTTDYLKDTLTFLNNHQWIYNFPNTHILVKDIFKYFPCDWFDYFKGLSNDELNKFPTNCLNNCPSTLKELLNKINTLSPSSSNHKCFSEEVPTFTHNCGLSDKKQHEIVTLAPIINNVCKSEIIIDIGSGLGYLSHHLNSKYGYKVLGIECSKQYIDLALKNQEKFYGKSKNEVVFKEHYINSESSETITTLVKNNFNSIGLTSSALVGLHACADLSITILDVFSELDFIKSLVIMPCCYHRIELQNATEKEELFFSFPISKTLNDVYNEFGAQKFLRRPFLRLSCQQSIGHFVTMTDKEHERHSRNLMFRCILQYVAEAQKMRDKWREYRDKCYLIEVLTGFQAAIQSMCENIILLDRIEYLKEKGFQCMVQKVTDDILSPRCHALIATKE